MSEVSVSTSVATGIARMLIYLSKHRKETDRATLMGIAGDSAENEVAANILEHFIQKGVSYVTDKQIQNVIGGDYSEICRNITPFLDRFGHSAPSPEEVQP